MMNYKETLFFIGKCLTINHEAHNRTIVEKALKDNIINWEDIVKVSTEHFVFPALYLNLKYANFLDYLPEDLVEYMKHITELNRERNTEIIAQAKRVNHFFIAHQIQPIFIKGTAFLLQGLYNDIAERMVGDIDFIVPPKDFEKAVALAFENGYTHTKNVKPIITDKDVHYPKITKENEIAAIEIHFRPTRAPRDTEFNYDFLNNTTTILDNGISTLSPENHILMTCFNKQISDRGYWNSAFALRNSYDLFLLSKQANPLKVITSFGYYFDILNPFLASSSHIFNHPASLPFQNNKKIEKLINEQIKNHTNITRQAKINKTQNNYFNYRWWFSLFTKSFYRKEYRQAVIEKITRRTKQLLK